MDRFEQAATVRNLARVLGAMTAVGTGACTTASATPFFARTYGLKCESCHSGFPRLNAFGLAFKANGFRIPNAENQAPLAWQRTIPLSAQVKPTIDHEHPGGNTSQFTDTQLLAGGLLTHQTSFYLHHTLWFDSNPPPFPSWELWAQQVVEERDKVMLKVGQFELPYSYSPEINRTTASTPMLFFGASVQPHDVAVGATMDGIQLSAAPAAWRERVRLYIAGGAPSSSDPGTLVGDRQFLGRFRDVFGRAAYGPLTRQAGAFFYLTSPPLGPGSNDSARRFGLDGILSWRGFQLQGMATYGEDDNPLGNGTKGIVRGAFVEADRMFGRWIGITGRLDVVTTSTSVARSYGDAKTVSLRVYPLTHLKFVAEQQWFAHGGSSTWFMADVTF